LTNNEVRADFKSEPFLTHSINIYSVHNTEDRQETFTRKYCHVLCTAE